MIAGLAGRNVAEIVNSTPRGSGWASKALSVAQAEAVASTAARGTRLEAYLALSLMTGIRTEEARALTWEHVDLRREIRRANPPVPPPRGRVALGPVSWRHQDRAEQAHAGDARVRRRRAPASTGTRQAAEPAAGRAAVERGRSGLRQHDWHSPQRRERRTDFQRICETARGGGVDATGAAALVRKHAVRRRRGDRGHLTSGRPFQHAHDRARLPARDEGPFSGPWRRAT